MDNRLIYATAKIKDKRMSITTVPNKHPTFKLYFRLIFFQWTPTYGTSKRWPYAGRTQNCFKTIFVFFYFLLWFRKMMFGIILL
jgi:hypothetical protein